MSLLKKIKRAIRGEVAPTTAVREVVRRSRASLKQKSERANLDREAQKTAHLHSDYATMEPAALLNHFQQRQQPKFFPGFNAHAVEIADSQRRLFPEETGELIANAERITLEHCWPLLGLGERCFSTPINWHLDPQSGFTWPLDYYGDINLLRRDGSDVRLVWELNRFGHFLSLARAYAMSDDQRFSDEFFRQLESWHTSNPLGRGVNWNCAMEVALRAMNLLGAFSVFRHAPGFDEKKLLLLLRVFDQHGRYIQTHLEFSHIATSNHYLSDVIGLLWLGVMLPELEQAGEWRAFGLREMLREMDKQVLGDGADFESSTGYHRFVLELFLYSFLLCRANAIEIKERYWEKLHQMLRYIRAYVRPDGGAPLIGDSDSGQVFPVCRHRGDDHEYLPALGSVLFNDSRLKGVVKTAEQAPPSTLPPELLWILGATAVDEYLHLGPASNPESSRGFRDAGIYILRDLDLYLLFNASGAGIKGRGSHGHNDVLSIEVSAYGVPFIVDPGTYVYTSDLNQRQLFRSTAYHSTVQIDGADQNTTNKETPFVIGNEAQPEVLNWETGPEIDRVSAQHAGFKRLSQPVTHRRTVTFYKEDRYWLLKDEFMGIGEHQFVTRFHFDSGLVVEVYDGVGIRGFDQQSGKQLLICPIDFEQPPELVPQFTSSDYGQKFESLSACWSLQATVPAVWRWVIIPVRTDEDEGSRLQLAAKLRNRSPWTEPK